MLLRDLSDAQLLLAERQCGEKLVELLERKRQRQIDLEGERRWEKRPRQVGISIGGAAVGAAGLIWDTVSILSGLGFGITAWQLAELAYNTWGRGTYIQSKIRELDFHIEQVEIYRAQIRFILSLRADGRLPNDVPGYPVRRLDLE